MELLSYNFVYHQCCPEKDEGKRRETQNRIGSRPFPGKVALRTWRNHRPDDHGVKCCTSKCRKNHGINSHVIFRTGLSNKIDKQR